MSDAQTLLLNYGYFHIMFVLQLTYSYKYQLASQTADGWACKDIAKDEALRLSGGDELKPNWWWRYGLIIVAIALPVVSITISVIQKS